MGNWKFGGLDLRAGSRNTAGARQADDIHVEDGTVRPRNAHTLLTSNTVGKIDGIFNIAGALWALAGGNVYKYNSVGGVFDASTGGMYTNGRVPFPVRIKDKAYCVDGAIAKVFDGTTIRTMGVKVKPTQALTVARTPLPGGTGYTSINNYTLAAPTSVTVVDTTVGTAVAGVGGTTAVYSMWAVTAWNASGESIERQTGRIGYAPFRTYTGAGAGFHISWTSVVGATFYTVYLIRVGHGAGAAWEDLYWRQTYSCKIAAPATDVYFTATSSILTVATADTQIFAAGVQWKDAAGVDLGTPSTTNYAPSTANSYFRPQKDFIGNRMEDTRTANTSWFSNLNKIAIGIKPAADSLITGLYVPLTVVDGAEGGSALECRVYKGGTFDSPESGEYIMTASSIGYPGPDANTILDAGAYQRASFNFTGIPLADGTSEYFFIIHCSLGKQISTMTSFTTAYTNVYASYYQTGAWFPAGQTGVSLFYGIDMSLTASATNGVLNGEYIYGYTVYAPSLDLETDLHIEDAGTSQTYSNEQAVITITAGALDATYTKYRIYRQGGPHTNFMLITEGTTNPYTDGKSDLILTEQCASIGNAPPPTLNGIIYLNGKLYGWDSSQVYVSEPWPKVEVWKAVNFFPTSNDSATIKQCLPYQGEAIILCSDGVRALSGVDASSYIMRDIPGAPGASSVKGAAVADGFVMYLSPKGIYGVNSSEAKAILSTELASLFDGTDALYPWGIDSTACAIFLDKHFILSYPASIAKTLILDGKHPELGIIAYVDSGSPTAIHYDSLNQRIVFGSGLVNGSLYSWRTGAKNSSFIYKTAPQDFGGINNMKWFHQLMLYHSGSMQITPSFDGVDATPTSDTDTTLHRSSILLDAYAHHASFKFVGQSSTAELYDIDVEQIQIVGGRN